MYLLQVSSFLSMFQLLQPWLDSGCLKRSGGCNFKKKNSKCVQRVALSTKMVQTRLLQLVLFNVFMLGSGLVFKKLALHIPNYLYQLCAVLTCEGGVPWLTCNPASYSGLGDSTARAQTSLSCVFMWQTSSYCTLIKSAENEAV